MGRNPRTGEAVPVKTKQILRFRAGDHILKRLNCLTTFTDTRSLSLLGNKKYSIGKGIKRSP